MIGDADLILFLIFLLAIVIAAGVGAAWERARSADLVERAADATVDELVARQEADDRRAVAAMPPGIDAGDAVELAAERGIGVREAALVLFRAQAKARLETNLRRHHPANRSKRP